MSVTRRALLGGSAGLLAAPALLPSIARASDWPNTTVRLVVPFAAGGPADFVGRLLAERLQPLLGQSVVIDNRTGAGGAIGLASVASGRPDGYSIVIGTLGTHTMTPVLLPNSGVDSQTDLQPLAIVGALPNVLVVDHKTSPVKTVAELVARGKREELTFGTFGPGSSPHVVSEMFMRAAGFRALNIPYTGSATAITALLGGQLDFLFDSITTSLGHVRGGSVRALAVSSATRLRTLPDVPTMKEAGVAGVDFSLWLSMYTAKGTPEPIVRKLQAALTTVSRDPDYIAKLEERGAEAMQVETAALPDFLARETTRWRTFLHDADIRIGG